MELSGSTLKQIKQKVDNLVKQGATKEYALSVICQQNGLNVIDVMNHLGLDYNDKDESSNLDVGDYVTYNNKKYEIINITNDDYILRNIFDNEVINVKQNKIIPMVMENNMNKNLNEAQYTVSIDNLETTDAETLSQMLSLAGQAEQPVMDDPSVTEIDTVPAEPVSMEEPVDVPADPMNGFEPTISPEMDGPGFEAAEIDNPETAVSGEIATEEEAPSTDVEEITLNEGDINEDVLIPTDKEKDMKDSSSEENLEKEEVVKEETTNDLGSFLSDYYYDNAELQSEIDPECLEKNANEIYAKWKELVDSGVGEWLAAEKAYKSVCSKEIKEEDFDEDIAETLRIAGVQLDEVSDEDANKGKKDLPVPPVGKANPAKTADVPEGQAPDYQEISTEDVAGYESSKGFEDLPNIKVESIVNKNKVNAILETAKAMYSKKDKDVWLALDRRYIDKLIKEGYSYSSATKMLQDVKMGK